MKETGESGSTKNKNRYITSEHSFDPCYGLSERFWFLTIG